MPIRLAPAHDPARNAGRHAAGRGLVTRVRVMAANDNGAAATEDAAAGGFDPLLVDALRHFARHGLDSVRIAHDEARRSAHEGNGPGAAHWIAITGMFDRRLAASARSTLASG
jgi:hypothetical protein